MKRNQIIYWSSTILVSGMMLFSAFAYLTNEQMKQAFIHLGFPNYFRVELAIAKLLGAIVLLVPIIPGKIKEIAYAGFGIVFVSAVIAHVSSGDPVSVIMAPVVFFVLLLVSWAYNTLRISKESISIVK